MMMKSQDSKVNLTRTHSGFRFSLMNIQIQHSLPNNTLVEALILLSELSQIIFTCDGGPLADRRTRKTEVVEPFLSSPPHSTR